MSYSTKAWIIGSMDIYYIYYIFFPKHKILIVFFGLISVTAITGPVCKYTNRIKVYNACLSNVQQSKKKTASRVR